MKILINARDVSRRSFLIGMGAAGAGLSFGFYVPPAQAGSDWSAQTETSEVNAWVVIEPDDTVIIRIARSEMGQGTLTGLAQLVAEELECDWEKVTTEYPTPGRNLARDRVWGSYFTGGSRGVRDSQVYVREGGAMARIMLVGAAADRWGVPAGECSVSKGVITHDGSGRTLTYGAVAADAARRVPPESVTLKEPSAWTIAGQSLLRLDTADKLNGKQVYGADLTLPGMLNASIKACPVFGGRIVSFEAGAVMGLPGVKHVLQVGENAVAVVADTWWRANSALEQLPITWDDGGNGDVSSASIAAFLEEGLTAERTFVGNEAGDVDAALAGAAKTVEATYHYPYQNHACMEPMNATALFTGDRIEVWCPTQNGEGALAAASEASGLPQENCEVHKIHLGGGFGRRGATQDYVTQAVLIAMQIPGTPIKLLWSREEDMAHGFYHPITMAKMEGGLDADGKVVGLRMRISGQSIQASFRPEALLRDGMDWITFQSLLPQGDHRISYDFPAVRIDHAMRNPHVPPGFWRGVCVNQNAIYIECFMDEFAEAAGVDPLEFRRGLMAGHPRQLAVLNAVAERGDWGTPSAPDRHQGLAVCFSFGSAIAALAEVSVADGELTVHKITAATDPVRVVNPQQVEAQIEGSFVFGLSALLYQEITIANGRVEQLNFDTYPSMTIAAMPEVETIIIESAEEEKWGGVGEPTIAVAAPAVLNAVYRATGQRVRSFPLSKADLTPT